MHEPSQLDVPISRVRTCGECVHWKRDEGWAFGDCQITLPVWAEAYADSSRHESATADDCRCFQRRDHE